MRGERAIAITIAFIVDSCAPRAPDVHTGQSHSDAAGGAPTDTGRMSTMIDHLEDPAVVAAQKALSAYLAGHPEIGARRELTEEGLRLHDAVVTAAQEAYRAAHPEAFDG